MTDSPESRAEVSSLHTGIGAPAVASSHPVVMLFLIFDESTCLFHDLCKYAGECVHQMHLSIHKCNSSIGGWFGGLLVIQYVITVPTIKEVLSPLISVAEDS